MEATLNTKVRLPKGRDQPPRTFRLLEIATILAACVCLALALFSRRSDVWPELLDVVVWLPIVVIADLMPVTLWRPLELTMSFPVLLAAAMVFPPPVVFLLGFVGNTDLREFRRIIPIAQGMFNRSNIGLSVFVASWLFHQVGGNLRHWPIAIVLASSTVVVDIAVNNSLTFVGAHLLFRKPTTEIIADVYGRGQTLEFLFTYLCFGSVALLLASLYLFAGNWGLVAFMIPLVLARQMFARGAALGDAVVTIRHHERAFESLSQRVADERREERLTVAADLHDEVLPPLFKVHLMGQVIRQDLARGRLLELDDDVPGLLEAADAANDAIRVLIRDLRRSSLGPHGLRHTLSMLTRQVAQEFGVSIHAELDEVSAHPLTELLAYQIAREAMNNCIKHAPGSAIRVALIRDDDDFRLVIADDGPGFVVESVDTERHFGLQLMRERVELCGGIIVVDSVPGNGTTVAAKFPLQRA
jgi:signal transduction histidine kinase